VNTLPNLSYLSHAEKDELIRRLWTQVEVLTGQVQVLAARVAELEARLGGPPKTPDNSSLPPSKGQKPDIDEKPKREGPRKGSIGRKGGGRALEAHPDETVIARPVCCAHCQAAFLEADLKLSGLYDKIDLPPVKPVVTRVERYAGHCHACGKTTLAPVPEGLEPGTPFRINIMTLALYLRFTHAISYRRLTNLMLELFGLTISEGALDAMFQRSKSSLDAEVSAIVAPASRPGGLLR
jgi:transposase